MILMTLILHGIPSNCQLIHIFFDLKYGTFPEKYDEMIKSVKVVKTDD